MKDFLATIFELVFYQGSYQMIYDTMFNDQGYLFFWLLFLGVPLVAMAIFYFEWWFPYLKAWHWAIAVGIGLVIVFTGTVSIFNLTVLATGNQQLASALANPDSGYYEHASVLRFYYGFYNVLLALFVSLIFSAFFKRFSKLHSHLPI